ncbi:uncharacterized protein BCR38DRAFT_412976 [Pseudomassariella vexata]|uniref:Myb-like domain-containing protein n=1 Tax=Pseudomassariella vexata TaxID=1141098 RepID=A0A1Y2DJ68_9PEZI|nr:uncharacterized protein BCR38DRAFT_412976 [Pseudomassariella vexata]ORY59277.1 hypothetical protein BCR38DRAFT_412976 [Pseudomassariella vexata]
MSIWTDSSTALSPSTSTSSLSPFPHVIEPHNSLHTQQQQQDRARLYGDPVEPVGPHNKRQRTHGPDAVKQEPIAFESRDQRTHHQQITQLTREGKSAEQIKTIMLSRGMKLRKGVRTIRQLQRRWNLLEGEDHAANNVRYVARKKARMQQKAMLAEEAQAMDIADVDESVRRKMRESDVMALRRATAREFMRDSLESPQRTAATDLEIQVSRGEPSNTKEYKEYQLNWVLETRNPVSGAENAVPVPGNQRPTMGNAGQQPEMQIPRGQDPQLVNNNPRNEIEWLRHDNQVLWQEVERLRSENNQLRAENQLGREVLERMQDKPCDNSAFLRAAATRVNVGQPIHYDITPFTPATAASRGANQPTQSPIHGNSRFPRRLAGSMPVDEPPESRHVGASNENANSATLTKDGHKYSMSTVGPGNANAETLAAAVPPTEPNTTAVPDYDQEEIYAVQFTNKEVETLYDAVKERQENKWKIIGRAIGRPADHCERRALAAEFYGSSRRRPMALSA